MMGKFDSNETGESPSKMIKTSKIGSGQMIKSAYPQDNQSGYPLEGTMSGMNGFGGGDTYLGHSLKGASAVMEPNKSGKPDSGRDLKGRKG
jgi:hypothetical protein